MEFPKTIYHSVKMKDIVEFHLQEHLTETFETLTTAYYLSEVDKDDLNEYHFHHNLSYEHILKSIRGHVDFEADVDPIRLLTNMSQWILEHQRMTNDEKMDRLKCHYEVLQRYFPYPTTLYKEIGGDIIEYKFFQLEYDKEYDEMLFIFVDKESHKTAFGVSEWMCPDVRIKCFGELNLKSFNLHETKLGCFNHALEEYFSMKSRIDVSLNKIKQNVLKLTTQSENISGKLYNLVAWNLTNR